jgi:uncharacterized protein YecE (DUF72 family)
LDLLILNVQFLTFRGMTPLSGFTRKRAVTKIDVDGFKRGIDPLADAGKLGAEPCCARFPSSAKRNDASVDYLTYPLKTFGNYRRAVELRHRSSSDEFGETLTLPVGTSSSCSDCPGRAPRF